MTSDAARADATTRARVWPGQPSPLGATWDGKGVNFALFSAHAETVELCLFDAAGMREIDARRPARIHRRGLARLSAGARPGSFTATASTARTSRGPATASIRTSCCSTPMRGRSYGQLR